MGTSDVASRLAALSARAQRLSGALAGADQSRSRPVTATDATGCVTIELAPGSEGIAAIRVSNAWRNQLEPAGLGAAIVEASRAAMAERMTAWGKQVVSAVEQLQAGEEPSPEPPPPPSPMQAPGTPLPPLEELQGIVRSGLEDAVARARAVRAREPAEVEEPTTAASGQDVRGQVEIGLTPDGQAVTLATVDAAWGQDASAERLNATIAEALHAAQDALGAPEEPAPTGSVDPLLADPVGLLRQLLERIDHDT